MARDYTVTFSKVSVAAVQDLWSILGSAGKIAEIRGFSIDDVDTTAPTDQQVAIRCRFSSATFTAGSGGSAPTPAPVDPGDSAASFTARANDTSQGTTSGSFTTKFEGGFNVKAGIE